MLECQKIIYEMKLCKVKPDLVTFNNFIRTVGDMDNQNVEEMQKVNFLIYFLYF